MHDSCHLCFLLAFPWRSAIDAGLGKKLFEGKNWQKRPQCNFYMVFYGFFLGDQPWTQV